MLQGAAAIMKTRAERTAQILDDLRDLWEHMDETHPIMSSEQAAGMCRAGFQLILASKPGELKLSDAMAQCALLLTMVRETIAEHEGRMVS